MCRRHLMPRRGTSTLTHSALATCGTSRRQPTAALVKPTQNPYLPTVKKVGRNPKTRDPFPNSFQNHNFPHNNFSTNMLSSKKNSTLKNQVFTCVSCKEGQTSFASRQENGVTVLHLTCPHCGFRVARKVSKIGRDEAMRSVSSVFALRVPEVFKKFATR